MSRITWEIPGFIVYPYQTKVFLSFCTDLLFAIFELLL